MQARGQTRGGSPSVTRRTFRWAIATVTALLLFVGFTTMVGAQTHGFDIVIPIDTVVRAPEGSVTVLETAKTPRDLVGETCRVTARSENQSSIHPENDLIVESEGSIVLEDVEAVPRGTVTATEKAVLSEAIVISLLMGPDEVFSAGIYVQFDCPRPSTTTTSRPTTTTEPTTSTTVEQTTTTIVSTTVATSSTTTTIPSTTSTSESTTTTGPTSTSAPPSTTSTSPPTTTSTTEDEVLAFTGPEDDGLGLIAMALAALGAMLLIGERSLSYSPSGRSLVLKRCRHCERNAVFSTPHGGLCLGHTRKALNEDSTLWMPRRLK